MSGSQRENRAAFPSFIAACAYRPSPQTTKQIAVLTFMVARPGNTLVNIGSAKIHPASVEQAVTTTVIAARALTCFARSPSALRGASATITLP
jgi:hypothetical protein